MDENTPPTLIWPPVRAQKQNSGLARAATVTPITTPARPTNATSPSPILGLVHPLQIPHAPFTPTPTNTTKTRPQYRNGYEVKPPTPAHKPYALNSRGQKRRRAFAFDDDDTVQIRPRLPKLANAWNTLAWEKGLLPSGMELRQFQVDSANIVIEQRGDVCVIAPTGAGKSLVWLLPLLVQTDAIALVITPYTNLGIEGQTRTRNDKISSIFIYSEQKDTQILEDIARGVYRVVFVCAEMLEGPTFAQVLHSIPFQRRLLAIYIDEAHLLHESHLYRGAYGRLKLLRDLIGYDIPLIAMSATLPSSYRQSLHTYAGLKTDFTLINLGNYRPELSTVIIPLQHGRSSFLDVSFVFPSDTQSADELAREPTIVYTDDTDLLTAMFWWAQTHLKSLGLPGHLVDILHAGLTADHQAKCLADFQPGGKVVILLATEKIGCGMNFPHVRRVVQYLCRGLTLVRWEQRRGRCARKPGMLGTGYLIAEPRMVNGTDCTVHSPNGEDPGLLDLLQSDGVCCDAVYDQWLENPIRPPPSLPRLCCATCYPNLKPARKHRFIMVSHEDQVEKPTVRTNKSEKELIYEELVKWRLREWREHWREQWPEYGPKSIIADADLASISKHIGSLNCVEDLRSHTHITHWTRLAEPLFNAARSALVRITGAELPPLPANPTEITLTAPTPTLGSSAAPSTSSRRARVPKQSTLQQGEMLVSFT
ncbi:hypothetical protein HWV62_17122 [Athelia sp. TMB]|nr:hypothetical protein HWV62_17122 [Athelia sp. TMB]